MHAINIISLNYRKEEKDNMSHITRNKMFAISYSKGKILV